MKTKMIKCPNCNGTLTAASDGDTHSMFCSYCGEKILIEDNQVFVVNQNINYTNEADVIRAKNEAVYHKRKSKRLYLILALLLLIPVMIFSGIFIHNANCRKQGMVNAGSHRQLIGKPYAVVVKHLETAGFTNIQLVDLKKPGILYQKNDKVAMISIGGNCDFTKLNWFEPDTPVVINYH